MQISVDEKILEEVREWVETKAVSHMNNDGLSLNAMAVIITGIDEEISKIASAIQEDAIDNQ